MAEFLNSLFASKMMTGYMRYIEQMTNEVGYSFQGYVWLKAVKPDGAFLTSKTPVASDSIFRLSGSRWVSKMLYLVPPSTPSALSCSNWPNLYMKLVSMIPVPELSNFV